MDDLPSTGTFLLPDLEEPNLNPNLSLGKIQVSLIFINFPSTVHYIHYLTHSTRLHTHYKIFDVGNLFLALFLLEKKQYKDVRHEKKVYKTCSICK